MEKGNEGDEIIFLAFRQAELPLPAKIESVRDLTPDQSVELISRSLYLISNGDVKFPLTLPANIATRHRICTAVAQKIKELGFLGECGYNQLLYPVEAQTREILTFIVEKLPRTEDEGAQEVLGANALLNRKITQSLVTWKNAPWKLPVALSHRPPLRPNGSQRFRTAALPFHAKDARTSDIFRVCAESKLYLESSVIERNTAGIVADAIEAARLESDLRAMEGEDGAGGGKDDVKNAVKAAMARLMKGAAGSGGVKGAQKYDEDGNLIPDSADGADGATVDADEVLRANQLSVSLQDLISNITNSYNGGGGGGGADGEAGRGTRFSHAMEFAQEASTTVAGSLRNVGGARPGFAASLGAIDLGDGNELAARKAQKEQEEKERQEELEVGRMMKCVGLFDVFSLQAMRAELAKQVSGVEEAIKGQAVISNKIKQYETDLAKLTAETEALEKQIIVKRKTLEMLPSAAENIKKLQAICNMSKAKLDQLEAEWETHKGPLVEQLRVKKGVKAMRRAKCRGLVDEMKKCREDMVTMIQDLKDKQDRAQMLTEEMSKLPKNINRAIYTHRIMDITASIGKSLSIALVVCL